MNILLSLVMTVGTLEVVATGDAHTQAYAPPLEALLVGYDINANLNVVASAKANTNMYLGREVDPEIGTAHNFIVDTLNYQPDLVLLMLGTNDVLNWDANVFFTDYQQILNSYPNVISSTLIPILPNNPQLEAANNIIQNSVNPYIRDIPGYVEIGVPASAWYGNDGINLWGQGGIGYVWMADKIARAIVGHYPGDHDFNGVDGGDYTVWADHFHKGMGHRNGDYNLDGYVSGADYTIWADNIPRHASSLLIPEASTYNLLIIAMVSLCLLKLTKMK